MKTLSDHVFDITQNSVKAGATWIEIKMVENLKNDLYSIGVKDNGYGMSGETLKKAADPFFTTRKTRKVGLGLSLLKNHAEAANGSFNINSEVGKGTDVFASFQHSHLDRPPVGDIWNTWYLTYIMNPSIRLKYSHKTDVGTFDLDSDELKTVLNGASAMQKEIKQAIFELIDNNLKDIHAGN